MDVEGQTRVDVDESHGDSPVQAAGTGSNYNAVARVQTPSPFVSKLCGLCLNMEPMPHPLELGIADFCIGDSSSKISHTMYQDGMVALSREEFKTFEPENGLISGSLICAWAAHLNHKWQLSGKRQACMPLVNTPLISEEVLQHWKICIKNWNMDLLSAHIVLIPFRHHKHTVLLVVNFSKQKLHCVDIRGERRGVAEWDRLADSVIVIFYMLLMEIGDDRCNLPFHKFAREVMSPHWGSPTHTDDGLCVMQLMDWFNDSTKTLDKIIAEHYPLFLRERVSICGQIAMSWVNRVRDEVLSGFIVEYRKKHAASTSYAPTS